MSDEDGEAVRPIEHLEFDQAMVDFTTMFPDTDRDVIEEVLRANQGAVDATIDALLAMTTDTINEALRLDLEKTDTAPDVTRHCNGPLRASRKWAPPHLGPLPPTFLRLTPAPSEVSVTGECGEDERIAMLLQNEEFLSELRINQDFLSSLDNDLGERGAHDPDAFRDKLRHMGKVSKNKFTQLARVFQRRKKSRSGKGLLEQSSSDGFLMVSDSLSGDRESSTAANKG